MFASLSRCPKRHQIAGLSVLSLTTVTSYSFSTTTQTEASSSKKDDAQQALFEDQCLKRQMHRPNVPYPAWDYNWDGNVLPSVTDLEGHRNGNAKEYGKNKKTRHIILVR
jgi:hypothetical protein